MGQCLCKEKLKFRKASKNAPNTLKVENGTETPYGFPGVNVRNVEGTREGLAGSSDSSGGRCSSSGNEKEKKAEAVVDKHVKKMLSVIRKLVDNDDSPPDAMRSLSERAEEEDGWIAIVNSMIRVIPISDPLGPAVMLLLLDECPLPTKSSVAEFLRYWPLTRQFSHLGVEDPQTHRNVCVILSCLAEKLAGPASTTLLLNHNSTSQPEIKSSLCHVPDNRSKRHDIANHGDGASDDIPGLECSILGYLLENLSVTRDPNVVLFSLIALEKFAQTSQSKILITQALSQLKPNPLSILELWRENSASAKRQVGFLAQWYLDNLIVPEGRKFTYLQTDYSSTKALLNAKDVSEYLKISADGLEARCDASSFESVRCTHPVDEGTWYYEVEVVTAGVMQIGWATKLSKFLNHEGYGIGDDETSLAYDGCRQVTWFSATSSPHSHPEWKSGDVLGCLLSLVPKNRFAAFFLNGKPLPDRDFPSLNRLFLQFEGHFGASTPLPSFFAAASFMSFQQCIFNFGKNPFRYPPPFDFQCFNEVGTMSPDSAAILPRHVVMAELMAGSGDAVAEDACTLCCDEKAAVTLLPCRHTGFCRECAKQMNNCPMCRTTIETRQSASLEGDVVEEDDGDMVVTDGLTNRGRCGVEGNCADVIVYDEYDNRIDDMYTEAESRENQESPKKVDATNLSALSLKSANASDSDKGVLRYSGDATDDISR